MANPVHDVSGKMMEVDSRFNCDGSWPQAQDSRGSVPESTRLVEMVTLQQVLPQDFSSIYFAKVDTEGGELSVLHALLPFILQKKVKLCADYYAVFVLFGF